MFKKKVYLFIFNVNNTQHNTLLKNQYSEKNDVQTRAHITAKI